MSRIDIELSAIERTLTDLVITTLKPEEEQHAARIQVLNQLVKHTLVHAARQLCVHCMTHQPRIWSMPAGIWVHNVSMADTPFTSGKHHDEWVLCRADPILPKGEYDGSSY